MPLPLVMLPLLHRPAPMLALQVVVAEAGRQLEAVQLDVDLVRQQHAQLQHRLSQVCGGLMMMPAWRAAPALCWCATITTNATHARRTRPLPRCWRSSRAWACTCRSSRAGGGPPHRHPPSAASPPSHSWSSDDPRPPAVCVAVRVAASGCAPASGRAPPRALRPRPRPGPRACCRLASAPSLLCM